MRHRNSANASTRLSAPASSGWPSHLDSGEIRRRDSDEAVDCCRWIAVLAFCMWHGGGRGCWRIGREPVRQRIRQGCCDGLRRRGWRWSRLDRRLREKSAEGSGYPPGRARSDARREGAASLRWRPVWTPLISSTRPPDKVAHFGEQVPISGLFVEAIVQWTSPSSLSVIMPERAIFSRSSRTPRTVPRDARKRRPPA